MKKMKKYLPILLLVSLVCVVAAYSSIKESKAGGGETGIKSIDMDLAAMGSTMAYAGVINIMSNADSYLGKTIRLRGSYYSLTSERTDKFYHMLMIGDATACCEMGMEFVWNGDHDYPEEYSRVEITGVFGSYEELEQTYYYLSVDDLLVL